MQGAGWIELIKRIPAAQHDNLVAVTATGLEIMVQRIMRLEGEVVIFRGRPVGSTDQPRVILLPWDQLNHLAFQKAPLETEIHRLFGNGEPMPEAPAHQPQVEPEAAEAADAAPGEDAENNAATAASPSAPPPAAVKKPPLSKSVLLARLRARMASDASKS